MKRAMGVADDLFRSAKSAIKAKPPRYDEYFRLLRRASKMGHVEAQEALGSWLLEGMTSTEGKRILRRSPRKAVLLLQSAANGGNAIAQQMLGYCFDVGLGVKRDIEAAMRWYRRAASQGDMLAAWNMVILHREARNTRGERVWVSRSAQLGEPEACLIVARKTLVSGRSESERKHALRTLKHIANSDLDPESADAMFELANAYRSGAGVKPSSSLERMWLERASLRGHREARRIIHGADQRPPSKAPQLPPARDRKR